MTLRVRLALLLTLAVATSLTVAWVVTRRAVLAPFAKEVLDRHLDQVVYVADELEKGGDAKELGERLHLDIKVRDRPPRFARRRGKRGKRGREMCRELERDKREIIVCRGPNAPAAVDTSVGWVIVRRDLDVDAPAQRVGWVLLIIAGVIILVSIYAATIVTRPVQASVTAMERMAAGDLTHRLPEAGGKELAEVARAFNRMADRVDGLLRAERELMAGISHELRTPLARLRLEFELLRDREVPEKRVAAMESDLAEVDRLIGELLEMSRLQLGERQLEPTPLSLRAIIDEAIERAPLPKHSVVVDGDTTVVGDRPRLVRVAQNLLQNAGKYAPRGTTVTITIDPDGFTVRDEGDGVPEEDLDRLFEPFFRGVRGKRSGATGLGLGLMIARQVVDLHHGTIAARNHPDGGLVIDVRFPDNSKASYAKKP